MQNSRRDTLFFALFFGKAAKRKLIKLLDEHYKVTTEWDKRDRYKRIVGKVIQRNIDINLELVKSGYAWHYNIRMNRVLKIRNYTLMRRIKPVIKS